MVLGLRFADVARGDNAELSLRTLAIPYLRQIVARLDLTATLAVRRSAEAVLIARVESRHDEGGGAWVGRHVDLHCTAQGKALIVNLSDEELSKLFAGRELARFTTKTICSVISDVFSASVEMAGSKDFGTSSFFEFASRIRRS